MNNTLPEIVKSKDTLVTTSRNVAAVFGKQHKNVLRDIEQILSQVPEIFGRLNFEPLEYSYKNNLGFTVSESMYNITFDGFSLLVMGYTGKKAMQFKVAYIEEFNRMRKELFNFYSSFELGYYTCTAEILNPKRFCRLQQCVKLHKKGLSQKAIAAELGCHPSTVARMKRNYPSLFTGYMHMTSQGGLI